MKPWEYEPPTWGLKEWDERQRAMRPPVSRWRRLLRRLWRRRNLTR